ncbi:putative DNA binding protein [Bacillus phage vB_BsuM-Goe9]|nr:putative DNA binding protein [Bacillus phage vB_BsuM-Goe9]
MYVGEDKVKCVICGKVSASLGNHINKIHGISAKQYRERYDNAPVTSISLSRKYSSWQKGVSKKPLSESTKKKLSKNMSGRKLTEEHKKKLSKAKMGKPREMTEESKRKLSKSLSEALRGRKFTEEWKNNISKSLQGRKLPESVKEKIARSAAKQMSNNHKKSSSIETKCKDMLDLLNIKYVKQYRRDRYVFDFYLVDHGLFIECNGYYWHAHPKLYNGKELTDAQKRRVKADRNKCELVGEDRILWLWEQDINNRPKMCCKIIQDFIKGSNIMHSYDFPRRSVIINEVH